VVRLAANLFGAEPEPKPEPEKPEPEPAAAFVLLTNELADAAIAPNVVRLIADHTKTGHLLKRNGQQVQIQLDGSPRRTARKQWIALTEVEILET
jgi:hypothetical protein